MEGMRKRKDRETDRTRETRRGGKKERVGGEREGVRGNERGREVQTWSEIIEQLCSYSINCMN